MQYSCIIHNNKILAIWK